jgi:hypothetical protein
VALLLSCTTLPWPTAPMNPLGPDTLGQHQTGRFAFYSVTERPERVRYVADWGDNTTDSSSFLRAGDTVELTHAWSDTGLFSIRCRAQTEAGKLSGFSPDHSTLVRNYPPLTPAVVLGPDTVRTDSAAEFRTATTDPEADIVTYIFAWGDGDTVTAPGYASGDTARMLHAWSGPGEYQVRTAASDVAGHKSPWSPPHTVVVVP